MRGIKLESYVIRCKDCKYSYEDIGGMFCSYGVCVDCMVTGNFFCAYGKLKEGKFIGERGAGRKAYKERMKKAFNK